MSDPHRFDDLFSEFGPIRLRRMFGGEGICVDDVMIGIVFDDIVYFKTDEETRKAFKAANCKPFTFKKAGATAVTGWYALPDRLYDEPEELAQWARMALAVAVASPTVQNKRKKAAKARRPPKRKRG